MKLFSRIFSMLVIVFTFSVLFCTPTFAEESLSITVDGTAETTINPNKFGTSSVDVYVTSTARDGYKLSISDSDNNNSLVSSNGNSISPLARSVTEDNFTANSWGVKVGDNFLPVPKLTDNVLELADTTKAAINEKHTVTFGMKVDGTAVSGAYSSEVVFTAVANPLVVRKTTLQTGQQVNAIWKSLAKGDVVNYSNIDQAITSIQKFNGVFTDALRSAAQDIATADSDWPVYTWFDNGTIYYYTEADEVFFNANSSYMFFRMQKLASVNFNFGVETDVDPDGDGYIASVRDPVYITSSVTDMSSMFRDASSLASLNVSNWDTSKVTNMNSMFSGASSLISLNVSNWDTSSVTSMGAMFRDASSLASLNVSNWDTSKVTNMNSMFSGVSSLTSLDVSNWNTSSVTDMSSMFYGASSLISLNVSNWNTSSVTSMGAMFHNASHLISLDVSNWDTSSATDMSYMFYKASSLTSLDVSNWNTSKVADMAGMFDKASSLTSLDVSNWNTSKVADMAAMFQNASSLTALNVSNWNTSSVTDMSSMFYNASSLASLDVSNWNTSKVTNMNSMFSHALSLTSLDVSNWNTSKVADMAGMFAYASFLTSLDVFNWNTGNVTNMGELFYGACTLTILDLTGWDTSNVTNMSSMFRDASSLTTIYASDKFDTSAVTGSAYMFTKASKLVGGNGTVYNANHIDKEYARIDKPGAPGYFSEKIVVRKATLKTGKQVNVIWKSLANGNVPNYLNTDEAITSIQKFTGDFTDSIQSSAMDIATENSDCPVWSWFNNGTIYYYTEADEVFFNADSSYMFYDMKKLVSVDFNFGLETDVDPDDDGFIASVQDPVYITSSVINMSAMFFYASSLTTLDVSNWDTSKVTNMSEIFWYASSLTSLDVSNWDTSSVTDMSYMFADTSFLTSLNVSNWDTSKVTTMHSMFAHASSLTTLDVSNWDTSKVTDMYCMFYGASSLTTIYVSDKFGTSAVTDSTYMFHKASRLVGGNGTVYNANHIDKEYARIDKPGAPGYFTAKPAGN